MASFPSHSKSYEISVITSLDIVNRPQSGTMSLGVKELEHLCVCVNDCVVFGESTIRLMTYCVSVTKRNLNSDVLPVKNCTLEHLEQLKVNKLLL